MTANNEERDQTAEETKDDTGTQAEELGLTQEDEAVLLKRLRDLGYVD